MSIKNYLKDVPDVLKKPIMVESLLIDDEIAKKEQLEKLQKLEEWLGISLLESPIVFITELLSKFGANGFKIKQKPTDKTLSIVMLWLRIEQYTLERIVKGNSDSKTTKKIYAKTWVDFIKEHYGYNDKAANSLITLYSSKKVQNNRAVKEHKKLMENKSDIEKLKYIERLLDLEEPI